MSKLNPTLGADGVERVDLSVTFRLSRHDFVTALAEASYTVANYADELPEDTTEDQILAWVRRRLVEGFHPDLITSDEREAWAERQASKVWPS